MMRVFLFLVMAVFTTAMHTAIQRNIQPASVRFIVKVDGLPDRWRNETIFLRVWMLAPGSDPRLIAYRVDTIEEPDVVPIPFTKIVKGASYLIEFHNDEEMLEATEITADEIQSRETYINRPCSNALECGNIIILLFYRCGIASTCIMRPHEARNTLGATYEEEQPSPVPPEILRLFHGIV